MHLLLPLQSACRTGNFMEMAVIEVLSDILVALDRGDLAALTLLDLSVAFDAVDHATMIRRLQVSYGIHGRVLDWCTLHLSDCWVYVRSEKTRSWPTLLRFGVQQGSVLSALHSRHHRPHLRAHQLLPHLYADDTQVYGFCRPDQTAGLCQQITACMEDVAKWMSANRLQLNVAKTEFLWCSSHQRMHQLPVTPVLISGNSVDPASVLCDLGVWIDRGLSMSMHITKVVSGCFAVLCELYSIHCSVSRESLITLVVPLVLTQLDHCNAVLAGLPACQLEGPRHLTVARLAAGELTMRHLTPSPFYRGQLTAKPCKYISLYQV